MKKIQLTLSLLLFILFANAQQSALWGYGGVNAATFYQSNTPGYKYSFGTEAGLNYKVKYNIGLWGWEIGAGFMQKGVKFKNSEQDSSAIINYGVANGGFFYYFPLINDADVVVVAGAYAAAAIVGKYKSVYINSKLPFGDGWNRADAGIYVKFTYDIRNVFFVGTHFDMGFLNVHSTLDSKGDISSARNFSISLRAGVNLSQLIHPQKK